jgi:hypothetical protein
MKDRLTKTQKHNRPVVIPPVPPVEFLELDVRWGTDPAELVEQRLQRLIPSGALPLNSKTFRVR